MNDCPDLSDAEWLEQVRGAHFKRAAFLYRIFEEMREEFGEAKALELIGRATQKTGREQAPELLEGMKDRSASEFCRVFCTKSPVGAKLFEMERGPVTEEDGEEVAEARLNRCVLVEGWKAMGVPEAEIAKLCRAANRVDYGKMEGAGIEGTFTTHLADGDDCCTMRVRTPRSG